MNIFVLDNDPKIAARYLCDKHVVKMALETTQLLSTALNALGSSGPYRTTHKNHPCSIWARASMRNFMWLYIHGLEICKEYTSRYNKIHKCESLLREMEDKIHPSLFASLEFTSHPKCMPDQYKVDDVVISYRNYYIGDKARFAKWKTQEPKWYSEMKLETSPYEPNVI